MLHRPSFLDVHEPVNRYCAGIAYTANLVHRQLGGDGVLVNLLHIAEQVAADSASRLRIVDQCARPRKRQSSHAPIFVDFQNGLGTEADGAPSSQVHKERARRSIGTTSDDISLREIKTTPLGQWNDPGQHDLVELMIIDGVDALLNGDRVGPRIHIGNTDRGADERNLLIGVQGSPNSAQKSIRRGGDADTTIPQHYVNGGNHDVDNRVVADFGATTA